MMPEHDAPAGHLDRCQVCGGTDLRLHLDLGFHPPCDSLLWPDQLAQPERNYPLRFLTCASCSLAQIDYVVPAEELFFPDYPYRSGITQTLVEKLSQTAVSTREKFALDERDLVIDIGSNDGTVLAGFKRFGQRVLGVEATNIAEIANENDIETIQAFFDETLAQGILSDHGAAAVVTATNVFAHVAALGNIMRGVSQVLRDDGVFVTESHYIVPLLETVQYDSIYHEHLRYYSVRSIIHLFDFYGFTVVDVERIGNYGGSIRVFAVKGTGHSVGKQVSELLALEEELGIYTAEPYDRFATATRKARRDLLALVLEIVGRGERVVGIGCPGRASTLLNYTGLDSDLMPYIAEQSSSLKLGLYAPGRHIAVVDEQRMFDEQPEYAVMLSWHYAEPIIGKLRRAGLRSKIILPLPEVRISEI